MPAGIVGVLRSWLPTAEPSSNVRKMSLFWCTAACIVVETTSAFVRAAFEPATSSFSATVATSTNTPMKTGMNLAR